jgi:hypothetical protein
MMQEFQVIQFLCIGNVSQFRKFVSKTLGLSLNGIYIREYILELELKVHTYFLMLMRVTF